MVLWKFLRFMVLLLSAWLIVFRGWNFHAWYHLVSYSVFICTREQDTSYVQTMYFESVRKISLFSHQKENSWVLKNNLAFECSRCSHFSWCAQCYVSVRWKMLNQMSELWIVVDVDDFWMHFFLTTSRQFLLMLIEVLW